MHGTMEDGLPELVRENSRTVYTVKFCPRSIKGWLYFLQKPRSHPADGHGTCSQHMPAPRTPGAMGKDQLRVGVLDLQNETVWGPDGLHVLSVKDLTWSRTCTGMKITTIRTFAGVGRRHRVTAPVPLPVYMYGPGCWYIYSRLCQHITVFAAERR